MAQHMSCIAWYKISCKNHRMTQQSVITSCCKCTYQAERLDDRRSRISDLRCQELQPSLYLQVHLTSHNCHRNPRFIIKCSTCFKYYDNNDEDDKCDHDNDHMMNTLWVKKKHPCRLLSISSLPIFKISSLFVITKICVEFSMTAVAALMVMEIFENQYFTR